MQVNAWEWELQASHNKDAQSERHESCDVAVRTTSLRQTPVYHFYTIGIGLH